MRNAFLLFEVLIAILIASTVLVIIMQGLGNTLGAGASLEGYFKARLLAESKIAMLLKEPTSICETKSGRFDREEDLRGIYSWEYKITPVITPLWGTTTIPVNEARVTVKWKGYKYELVTYLARDEETAQER